DPTAVARASIRDSSIPTGELTPLWGCRSVSWIARKHGPWRREYKIEQSLLAFGAHVELLAGHGPIPAVERRRGADKRAQGACPASVGGARLMARRAAFGVHHAVAVSSGFRSLV